MRSRINWVVPGSQRPGVIQLLNTCFPLPAASVHGFNAVLGQSSHSEYNGLKWLLAHLNGIRFVCGLTPMCGIEYSGFMGCPGCPLRLLKSLPRMFARLSLIRLYMAFWRVLWLHIAPRRCVPVIYKTPTPTSAPTSTKIIPK